MEADLMQPSQKRSDSDEQKLMDLVDPSHG